MENQMKNEPNPEVSEETRENPTTNPEATNKPLSENPENVSDEIVDGLPKEPEAPVDTKKEDNLIVDEVIADAEKTLDDVSDEIVNEVNEEAAVEALSPDTKPTESAEVILDEIVPEEVSTEVVAEDISTKIEAEEPVSGIVEAVEEATESVAEKTGEVLEVVADVTEENVSDVIEAAPEVVEAVAEVAEAAPEVVEAVTKVADAAPEVVEAVTEVADAAPEVVEAVTKVADAAPEVKDIAPVIEEVPTAEIPVKEVVEADPVVAEAAIPVEEDTKSEDQPAAATDEVKKDVVSEEKPVEEVQVEHTEEEIEEKYNELGREELILALESALEAEDINSIKTRVAILKVAFHKKSREEKEQHHQKFLAEGGIKEEYVLPEDPLSERFNNAFKKYKSKRHQWLEQQEKVKIDNLAAKNNILEELRTLINSEETLKKTYDEFKTLQDRWREIGIVPREEVNNLWQSYHFLVEKFFDKVKINRELKDLDLKKNLESKIGLCEKVEELLLESSIIKSFRQLQKYHQEWKETGPVPQDKSDEIWDRFKSATDKINSRRREHYEELQQSQGQNLLAKTALCDKAEELLGKEHNSIKQWQDTSDQMNELFKVWRTIGPAPKENNDEIWERFRSFNETFYNAKKEYFNKLKEEQTNNYNLKLDLANQAEALKSSTDWKKTTQELINLQKQWKNIGPVPRKHSDKIWKQFRAACDAFFNAKSDYFSNIHEHEGKNLEIKKELIENLKTQEFTDNKGENLKILNGFQREWMKIGHVPMKDKDSLQTEFRKLVDAKLAELQISSVEMDNIKFKSRLENVKDDREASRMIYKERTFLQSKIQRFRDDINLWENNIGFLADSKQAQVLKDEFDKKINKAKQEKALLEAKLKMLNQSS